MTTFQMSAPMFADAAKGVVLAASTDSNLPAFTLVQIEVTPAAVILRATDRYRVHEATCDAINDGQELSVLVEAKALAAVGKLAAKSAFVTFTIDGESLTVDYGTGSTVLKIRGDQFVNVTKLYEAQTAGEIGSISIDPAFLADIDRIPRKDGRINSVWTFTFGETARKPVRATMECGHIKWDCLIMPQVVNR